MKPTVRSSGEKGVWKDVAPKKEVGDVLGASLLPSSVLASDASFASSLRADGANQAGNSTQQRAKALPKSAPKTEGVFSRLTDSSGYTGAHKHRFDDEGRGLGRDGRDRVAKGTGHVPALATLRAEDVRQPAVASAGPVSSAGGRNGHHHQPATAGALLPHGTVESVDACHGHVRETVPGQPTDSCQNPLHFQPPNREAAEATASSKTDMPRESDGSRQKDDTTIEAAFAAYCGGKPNMDGRTFTKLCKDCRLFDKHFSQVDADLLFSKVVPKGQRRIEFAEFKQALSLVAKKKSVPDTSVLEAVSASQGPALNGTVAENVRFHDDKSTYTGVHAKGGPSSVPKGIGTATQLAAAGMKRAA